MNFDVHSVIEKLQQQETDELIDFAGELGRLERSLNMAGPQDDDELHAWILVNLGIDIPRAAVCKGHVAPFTLLADLYFERETAVLAMANRGGSKTFLIALLHLLNSKFKPGCESITVGAVEMQARRAYLHLQKLLKLEGKCLTPEDNPDIEASIASETRWHNGSKVEIVPGTPAAVNGPHPPKVHADEVEQMSPEVYDESRNMSQSMGDIKAQDILTSTRKRAHGQMQKIIDEIEDAVKNGFRPPYKMYTWCVFESAMPVKNCQVACPELSAEERCECDIVVKGKWDDGRPRRFSEVCQGRLSRSSGWIPISDLHKTFMLDSKPVWEAQQECSKPSTEGLVLKAFEQSRHGIRWWMPKPHLGPIFQAWDPGGTNPHGVGWYQLLRPQVDGEGNPVDIVAHGIHDERGKPKKILTPGTLVCFDELYLSDVGNMRMAKLVVAREAEWARKVKGFMVQRRFADMQAKAARIDWSNHNPPLKTAWYVTRDVKEHVKICQEIVDEDLFAVDIDRCEMFCEEAEAWRFPDKKSGDIDDPDVPVDDFDHMMSTLRYCSSNVHALELMRGRRGSNNAEPGSNGAPLPAARGGYRQNGDLDDAWRGNMTGVAS